MLRIALTGGIATGKSYVLREFRRLGVPCLDADELAREALSPHSAGAAEVAARFGPDLLTPDGTVDRKKLGLLVFDDPQAFQRAVGVGVDEPPDRRTGCLSHRAGCGR